MKLPAPEPSQDVPRPWTDPLPAAVVVFVVGIVAGLRLPPSTALGLTLGLALVANAVRRPTLALVVLLPLGALRGAVCMAARPPDVLAPFQGHRVVIRGTVVEPEVSSPRGCRFVLETRIVAGRPLRARLQVEIPASRRWPAPVHWGQEACVIGVIERPRSEGFDYAGWLAERDIFEVVRPKSAADVTCCGNGDAPFVIRFASSVRRSVEQTVEAVVPQPQAALLEGVLMAESRALPKDIADGFRDTGTYHVLVTAGIHLNFVAAAAFALCGACGLGGHRAALVTIPVVGFFALVAGASPSIVRAAIMATFSLLGHALGRPNGGLRGLCIAVALMVGWSPRLVGEAGFQMSVACVLGIVTMTPLLEPRLRRVPACIRGAVGVTLATQVMVAPLGALYFGTVSLGGLAANLVVVPICEGLLALGFGLAACGPLMPNLVVDPIAHALGLLAWGLGAAAIEITRMMRALPFCTVQVSAPSLREVAVWYMGLWGVMKLLRRGRVPDKVHNHRGQT